ncbi:GNAT family N-acetyltransferase [Bdellovibrio bacteriovorus]|uniref:GNAT family N-acetyltransferase n=1 Tax=Bdellovibrio TaxID=958 RepID=UPI0035A926AF
MKYKALSIVYPNGSRIARGEKTIEVRSWMPPEGFEGDLLIVENYNFLRKEGETDPEGKPVALVKIKNVRPFMAGDILAACATKWEPGYYSWELTDVRPISSSENVLAARQIYEVDLNDIRLAKPEDIEQLAKLRVLMQQEVNNIPDSQITNDYLNSVKSYFRESLSDKSYISSVAVVDGRIVAAAGLVFYQKPPSLPSGSGLVGYLTNVYTLPEYRKRGLGSRMIDLLIKEAKSMKAVKIHLGATEDGKDIYEKLGFKPVRFAALELNL